MGSIYFISCNLGLALLLFLARKFQIFHGVSGYFFIYVSNDSVVILNFASRCNIFKMFYFPELLSTCCFSFLKLAIIFVDTSALSIFLLPQCIIPNHLGGNLYSYFVSDFFKPCHISNFLII